MRVLLLFFSCVSMTCQAGDFRFRDRDDESRGRIWQLTRNGILLHEPGRSVRVPLPDWIYAGPAFGCLPDLALGPGGEALVSSDVLPVLWRVDARTLAVTRHELSLETDGSKDVGFVNLAWSAKEGAWLAEGSFDGALWRIDARLKTARRLGELNRLSTCRAGGAAAGASRPRGRRPQPW